MEKLLNKVASYATMLESTEVQLAEARLKIEELNKSISEALGDGNTTLAVKLQKTLTGLTSDALATEEIHARLEAGSAITFNELTSAWAKRNAEFNVISAKHQEAIVKAADSLRKAYADYDADSTKAEAECVEWRRLIKHTEKPVGGKSRPHFHAAFPTSSAAMAAADFFRELRDLR